MKHPRKQEGAALFIVLMIIMVGTASAVFAANTVSHELRGAGFARQQLQTRYAARAGIDRRPRVVRHLRTVDGPKPDADAGGARKALEFPTVSPKRPAVTRSRRLPTIAASYRLYPQHFEALLSTQDGGVTPGLLANLPI